MRWLCRCAGIVWEPTQKRVHPQIVREHSATVVSARWATVGWSGIKSGISVRELISTSPKKEKNKSRAGGEWRVEHSPKILASEEKATSTNELYTTWPKIRTHCHVQWKRAVSPFFYSMLFKHTDDHKVQQRKAHHTTMGSGFQGSSPRRSVTLTFVFYIS